jgi:2-keto-4-pentenoate hydratase/2-oxohepta-3-ene-1,7-dioic acid hydratase in catechol pathway
MKLMTFEINGNSTFGMIDGDKIFDIPKRLPDATGLISLLDLQTQKLFLSSIKASDADYNLADVTFRRPIEFPGQVVCIGINYGNRDEEYETSIKGNYPNVFLRTPETLAAHDQAMLVPPESEQLDYEGEIALVIGKSGRRIPRENALEHIGAITCLNEGCIRDWMRHGKANITQGKNFYRCGAVGPWLVTAEEFSEGYSNLRVTTRVNGEIRQDDTTANILYDFSYLISYASTWNALEVGDIISTGTPTGSGARMTPPVWLRSGDTVEVEVSGVGVLRNPIKNET